MPPRRQPRRNARHTNHSHANTDSNETPVDPNMVSAIHQAFEGLLPNFVAQTVEAVQNQNRTEGRGNTNRRFETNVNNTTEGIHVWIQRFQKQKPRSFTHATNPIDARNWIAHVEKIFEVLGVADQYKVRLATYKLEDDAQTWWEGYKQAKGGETYVATISWADFRTIFYDKYFSTADQEAYKREYAVIRQGNDEPASEFITRFARLASIVGDAAGSAAVQAEKCKWAVCDRIRKSIMFMKFKDLTEVADAMKTYEFERKEFLSRVGDNKKRDRDGQRIQTSGQSSNGANQQDRRVQVIRHNGNQSRPWQSRPQNPKPTTNQIQPYVAPVKAQPLNQDCTQPDKKNNVGASTSLNTRGRVFSLTATDAASVPGTVSGTLRIGERDICVLFDTGATHSIVSHMFTKYLMIAPSLLDHTLCISTPTGESIVITHIYKDCPITIDTIVRKADLLPMQMGDFDIILGMDWLTRHHVTIDCHSRRVVFGDFHHPDLVYQGIQPHKSLKIISTLKAQKLISHGCVGFLASIIDTSVGFSNSQQVTPASSIRGDTDEANTPLAISTSSQLSSTTQNSETPPITTFATSLSDHVLLNFTKLKLR
ncbi:hypothetical protein E3N88_42308 [Mikania micrantha]|uniref:Retrotransposon gag domain-containing protein n=1 Tax=Mikania micrantha TaxID=192012 RepID=A0A5N6LI70_9ASTR|nr:hypothetical protein E3N88_42308 [Mikania micrantha]